MSRLGNTDDVRKLSGLALQLLLVLVIAGVGAARAQATADTTATTETTQTPDAAGAAPEALPNDIADRLPKGAARPRNSGSTLDSRVRLLAKELDLDATQQARVKKVLEGQRVQVARVWNDQSIPAARRVSATQAIADRTADQIRALLTDEQRKKYIQPRQRQAAVGTAGGNVESWTKSAKPKSK